VQWEGARRGRSRRDPAERPPLSLGAALDLGDVLADAGVAEAVAVAQPHSCASLLLAQGVSARVAMEQLGHSQISLTMDTYSHVMPAMLRDAADALDAALAVGE
jgi:site-specific recombinase XerD